MFKLFVSIYFILAAASFFMYLDTDNGNYVVSLFGFLILSSTSMIIDLLKNPKS